MTKIQARERAPFNVRVQGRLALFNEPHFQAEPHTSPVMTPAAAAGILRSIYWKPQFEWEISYILVLAPIVYTTSRYGSLKDNRTAEEIVSPDPGQKLHTLQTHTCLANVDYVIGARMVKNPHREKPLRQSQEEGLKRMRRGEFFRWPFLGQNRYPVDFYELLEGELPEALDVDLDIGTLLWEQIPVDLGNGDGRQPDKLMPVFFKAKLEHGILRVPSSLYDKYRDQTMSVRNLAHPGHPEVKRVA